MGAFGEPFTMSLWVPSETFRWMTGPRRARSAGLLVGSIPSIVVKVQSAGQTLSRLLANRRCQRVRLLFGLACFEQLAEFGLDRRDLGLEPGAVVVVVLVGAPRSEHAAGELEPVLAEGLLLGQAVRVAAKVAPDVRPAHLASCGVEMAKPFQRSETTIPG